MTRRTPTLRASVLCLALGVAASGLSGCGPERVEELPNWLLGIWKTDAPRYQNRFLEVLPGTVVFGVAGMTLEAHQIERIDRSESDDGGEVYRLHYKATEGYDDTLVLHVEPGLRGLRVGERSGRWMRASSR